MWPVAALAALLVGGHGSSLDVLQHEIPNFLVPLEREIGRVLDIPNVVKGDLASKNDGAGVYSNVGGLITGEPARHFRYYGANGGCRE